MHKVSEKEYPIFDEMYKNYFQKLWESYNKLSKSINFLRVINFTENEKGFLSNELGEVYSLILDYITSANLYIEHISDKKHLDNETLAKCKSYMFKSCTEQDGGK